MIIDPNRPGSARVLVPPRGQAPKFGREFGKRFLGWGLEFESTCSTPSTKARSVSEEQRDTTPKSTLEAD
ncbi:hypothetical protein C489_05268 [Natrinema versiforme JCM 10478]|uniref:Uncharacterized protein n=1 Tax=Natrinema versiforme JCM 10478 TaxID=1227496 RepID=L9Y6I1_9EURY|nr:hypothetical protein C489_05268 [Natrinema versiforme JCM 10478]